jgi:pyruvate dehydrogenase E2 component (dihydrolipoamide acetyltransferase)
MATAVTVPRLGWNMDEGTFVEWLKPDGASVGPGDAIFRLEGEKATEEVESLDAGTLHIPADGPNPGEKIAVGAVIGYLLQPGEKAPAQAPTITPSRERPEQPPPVAHAPDSPRDKYTSSSAVTPRARRLATSLGVDCSTIRGTGRTGRIRERDVAAHSSDVVIPITPIRRAIAARMMESRQTTAPVTLTSIVDATDLVALRAQFKDGGGPTPSFTDCFVKLAAVALQKHPVLASHWSDAGTMPAKRIDIGIAVDRDAGLLVPVVRDVSSLGLQELAKRSRDLIDRARKGALSTSEMQGGCFTITNLGAYGIDAFTPIINPPECAVLGIGRVRRVPVMDGENIVGRESVTLSLTFDHRIVDGGPAARFLQTLAKCVENPGEHLQ